MFNLTHSAICALALASAPVPRPDSTDFAFSVQGGVTLAATGMARFGIVRGDRQNPAFFSLSLGGAEGNGALVLSRALAELPMAGHYAVTNWEGRDASGTSFQALFVAGTPSQPEGVFWGESGTVTIRHTSPGRIEGVFTIKARGFRAVDPDREDVTVTIHGTFTANGEQVMAQVTSVEPASSM
jgi:hypothetical protein